MRIHQAYECEICGSIYGGKEYAEHCESKGFPKTPPLPEGFEFNKPVQLYGQFGIKTATIVSVHIENANGVAGSHDWVLQFQEDWVPLGERDADHDGREGRAYAFYLDPNNDNYVPRN